MDVEQVRRVLDALDGRGVRSWVAGGWGVDALVGRQTRAHRDLDLAIDADDEAAALEVLSHPRLGYAVETDWRPTRVELGAPGGGWVDLHPVRFDADGHGRQADLDGGWFDYPATALTTGTIAGREVRCLSVRQQLLFHEGYELRDVDHHDLALLRSLVPFGCEPLNVVPMLPGMTRPPYPSAERLDLVENIHGQAVADPYRWLEDPADPRTVSWRQAQEGLLAAARETWPGQEWFRARLAGLLACGAVTAPVWRGDRPFFTRRAAGQEHAVLLTVDPDGQERVLVDPVALDPAGTTTLDHWVPSPEGDLLAYAVSAGGLEESDLYVMETATGHVVDGPIDRSRFTSLAWLPDGKAFWFTRQLDPNLVPVDEREYHSRVWLHQVGADAATDVMVFGDGGAMIDRYEVSLSPDGRWLQIESRAGTASVNDVWLADLTADAPGAATFEPVQKGVDASTRLAFARPDGPLSDRVYVRTDQDAPRGRLCVTTAEDLGAGNWRTLVPEDPDAVLHDYAILDGPELERPLLLVVRTRHAIGEITVHDLTTGERVGEVPLPGLGTVGDRFDHRISSRSGSGHEIWFSYTDFATPEQVYHYDATTGRTTLWAAAPGEIELPPVRVRQVGYPSKDGTEVRMFVLDDGTDPGPRPTVLYGYGGFDIALTPSFDPFVLAWVTAGGRYAIANLRGGSENGQAWHRAGMLESKQNVFDDFHAAADFLVAEGLTTADRLGIYGGSNGGLLVGAALTQHPEKYAAVVCSAPLLDMVRYERFGKGALWTVEYGSAADPEQFGWLHAYSPYHRVRAADTGTDYPATLFTVFDGDTRVDPLHARKLAAALQHATAGERPILLRDETGVGHGQRAVSRQIGVAVDRLAFLAGRLASSVPFDRPGSA
ncbi:prolyl oligopeptidase [Streptacidiphilus sp. MAP12-33]|uniref:prolyl oligopeptidase family serine peptidase n=1 Tax=Streptacidiphilus sp. MAP12-33 TaxID=3156266 RepID=UPI0035159339